MEMFCSFLVHFKTWYIMKVFWQGNFTFSSSIFVVLANHNCLLAVLFTWVRTVELCNLANNIRLACTMQPSVYQTIVKLRLLNNFTCLLMFTGPNTSLTLLPCLAGVRLGSVHLCCVGWQLHCDPIWQVTLRSCDGFSVQSCTPLIFL